MTEEPPTPPAPARVTARITGDQPPWGAPDVDLAARGYVLEEFALEGTARAFHLLDDPTPDGRWSVAEYARAPYRTRLLVLRPRHTDDANGTVVVGWQNVSAGYESGAPTHGEMYEGYTWVGVSAQEVGLYGFPAGMERMASRRALPLVEHDPARYGELHHPGDQAAFDLFTQAGRALAPDRERDRDHVVDPLDGLPVQRMVAAGGSQSAMRLATYLNAIHPVERAFDGFLLSVWEARAPRPEEGVLPMGVRTAIRTDTPTPVVIVNSEFESTHLAQVPCVDTEWLRVWEVAGTPHGNARSRLDEPDRRGRVANPLRYAPVHDAALRALHHWLADGVPAPHQPRIEMDPGPPLRIATDDVGNARGGIRLPEMAMPTATYRGAAMGTGRLPLFGAALPFTDDELRARYPGRAEYEQGWDDAVDALLTSGSLRPEDAPAMRQRAAEVRLPF
ncbi:MAG TPA: alpha/beta hydrolase domain-containing protein [Acidimicrobiia bacterium]